MRLVRSIGIAVVAAVMAFSAPHPEPALAVLPDEILDDPALESRARDISRVLRCLVCQNQSIDDSDAGLARDMRLLVRERLVAGDSDDEVKTFVRDRYGDFVLLNPPMNLSTLLLWFGPFLMFAVALAGGFFYLRGKAAVPVASGNDAATTANVPVELSAAEQARLNRLMKESGDSGSQGGSS